MYLQEAAAFLGAVTTHLPWSSYYYTLKNILKGMEKGKKEKEKIILNALCAVLDSFHFDLAGGQEATDLK